MYTTLKNPKKIHKRTCHDRIEQTGSGPEFWLENFQPFGFFFSYRKIL